MGGEFLDHAEGGRCGRRGGRGRGGAGREGEGDHAAIGSAGDKDGGCELEEGDKGSVALQKGQAYAVLTVSNTIQHEKYTRTRCLHPIP